MLSIIQIHHVTDSHGAEGDARVVLRFEAKLRTSNHNGYGRHIKIAVGQFFIGIN